MAENFFLVLLLFVLAVCVFIPTFSAGFIWDDDQLLTGNPQVKSPMGILGLWFAPATADYFPLMSSVLWLQCNLGQWLGLSWWNLDYLRSHVAESPWNGYHIVNVLFHATAAVLTWKVLKRLRIPGAWIAAAIFAVHPVCVESVAWVAESKNTISQVFFLLAILEYLKSEEIGCRRSYIWSVACFVLALLAKTSVVMLPFLLILLTWWRRAGAERLGRDFIRTQSIRMLPYFLAAGLLGVVTFYFQNYRAIAGEEIPIGNLAQRTASACFASGFYLYSAMWPFNIIEIYPQWHRAFTEHVTQPTPHIQPPAPESIPYPLQAVPGLLILAVLVFCVIKRKETWARAMLVGLGCYFIAMLPALGLMKMSYMRLTLVADHFQYISIAAVIALVVAAGSARAATPRWLCATALLLVSAGSAIAMKVNWGLTENNRIAEIIWIVCPLTLAATSLFASREVWKYVWYGFLTVVLVCFCCVSWSLSEIYHSEYTLWSATLDKNPYSWQANNHFGAALFQEGRWREAYKYFKKATELKPENPESHNNLGLTLNLFGRREEAIQQFEIAVKIKPDPQMEFNLGNAYLGVRRLDDAIRAYNNSIRLNPNFPSTHCNLGIALMQTGMTDAAIPEFMKAIELDAGTGPAYRGLIEALERKGINPGSPRLTGTYGFDLKKALELLRRMQGN